MVLGASKVYSTTGFGQAEFPIGILNVENTLDMCIYQK